MLQCDKASPITLGAKARNTFRPGVKAIAPKYLRRAQT
jgi:hypothetical protein